MGITGDRSVTEYEGHIIELVRNAWDKTLTLRIDGTPATHASCALPLDITLAVTLEHQGVQHTVTAKSLVHMLSRKDSIEVDGVVLPVTRTH